MVDSIKAKLDHPFVSRHLVPWIVPALFLIIMMFFYPDRVQFQANSDEGLDLMRAMLVDKGYTLYDQIWSDHPPLLAYILAAGFRLIGYKVGFSRYLILFFSLLLIWASGNILNMIWGRKTSLVGQASFLFLPFYLKLSLTIMTGLPSIAFAVLSLWALIEWHKRRKFPWLVVSASFLALSILTKIALGLLGLIFCVGLVISEVLIQNKKIKLSVLMPAFVFGFTFSLILISAAIFWIGTENLSQLWSPHVAGSTLEGIRSVNINDDMIAAWPWVVLGIIGFINAIQAKKWEVFYLLAWALTLYFLLLNHSPVWYHHQLNITVPLLLLGARPITFALEKSWNFFWSECSQPLTKVLQVVAILATMAILLPYRLPESIVALNPIPKLKPVAEMSERDENVMARVGLYKDQTEWVVTDMPMIAFRNRLPVPPELAYWSQKALSTGEITEADVIQTIESYQPEQVLLWRFSLPEVYAYLEDHYRSIYTIGDRGLWIRNDIEPIPIN